MTKELESSFSQHQEQLRKAAPDALKMRGYVFGWPDDFWKMLDELEDQDEKIRRLTASRERMRELLVRVLRKIKNGEVTNYGYMDEQIKAALLEEAPTP